MLDSSGSKYISVKWKLLGNPTIFHHMASQLASCNTQQLDSCSYLPISLACNLVGSQKVCSVSSSWPLVWLFFLAHYNPHNVMLILITVASYIAIYHEVFQLSIALANRNSKMIENFNIWQSLLCTSRNLISMTIINCSYF